MAEPLRQTTITPEPPRLTPVPTGESVLAVRDRRSPSYQAYQVLHVAFTVAPLVAGTDKFFHFLVNWDQYLAPIVPRMTGINGHTFMLVVGAIEIIAGIGVALKPKIFGYVVSAWLLGIVVNLLMTGAFFDIALRDFGLSLGALALARLSQVYDRRVRDTI